MKLFKQTKIASLIALTTTAIAAGVNAADLEEVVVIATPIKDAQAASLEAKRLASNVVDVIAADTIGRFPDQNMADSLGRVPGMAIERDQGQARYINFRGTPFRWTSIGFNGIDIPGAENGRIPRFDSFPSTITSSVEVNKAVLASMPGESVAGYVDIKTFNPFDREGVSFDLDLGTGSQDLGNGDISRESLRVSYSNDNFGFMAFDSGNARNQITDNQEPGYAEVDGQVELTKIRFASYKVERKDAAHGAHLEYRSDEATTRVFADYLYSEFVDLEERNHFDFSMDPALQVATIKDHLLEYGRYDNSSELTTLGTDFIAADWSIEARYNQTKTEFNQFLPIIYRIPIANKSTGSYDFSNPTNVVMNLDSPISDTTFMNLSYIYDTPLNIDADIVKLDATKMLGNWEFASGLQVTQRQANGFVGTGGSIFKGSPAFPSDMNPDDYRTDKAWYFNSNNSLNETYFDNIGLRKDWEAISGSLRLSASDSTRIAIDEDISAIYAMATNTTDWGNVVYGLRVEKTKYSSEGTIDGAAVNVTDSFTNVLPSLHINFDLADDLKARFSFTTGVNRPTYNEWRASGTIDIINQKVSGGNPSLEAEKSMGFDASLEYYFADASLLSVSAFQRNVDNVIYAGTTKIDGSTYGSNFSGQWDLSGYVNGSDGKLNGVEFNFIGQGIDLNESLAGFGMSLNTTLLDAEFKQLDGTVVGMPGTSDMMYNASVFFEDYGLSVRLNYQYRDEWISPIEDPSEVWGATKRLDLNAMYQLPCDLNGASATVYLNANNLTDEVDVRYDENRFANQVESYGPRYLVGIRVSY